MSEKLNPYRAAGTFSGPSYTERQADRDLLRAIQQNQRFPYVLAPRQSGKSSLITHVRAKLKAPKFLTAFVDFSIFTSRETSDLDTFQTRFFDDWRRSLGISRPLSTQDRFTDGVEELFSRCPVGRLIIFLDEIDALLHSEFKDTFFSILRNIFNERAANPEIERVQFVLSGAARPEELISDRLRSPFNVGESIVLNEFSLQETVRACRSLAEITTTPLEKLAETVFHYASGSVYLTQLILEKCWNRLMDSEQIGRLSNDEETVTHVHKVVDEIVAGAEQNIHFQNIRASFHSRKSSLRVYRKLLAGLDVSNSSEREILWFTGLSPREGKGLYRNRIYERIFKAGGLLDLTEELRPVPHNLPALRPFFGREEELRKIADALDPSARTWGALIDGPGGMGKTSLAVRAAYDAPADLFQRIVFVSLKSRELDDDGVRDLSGFLISGLAELLNELARELGHDEIVKAPEDQRPRLLLDALRGTRTLLLLDNLESLLKRERDTVFTFIKKLPPGCKAILTSRGRIGSGAEELILQKLSEEAALAALAELATHNPHLARTSEAERMVLHRETGGNTLLLLWTAGQIGRGGCLTFADALSFLRSCPPGNDPLEFVFGDLVRDFDPDETTVLCALTHFTRPVSVEHVAVTAGLGEPETDRALRELTNRSLAVPDEELKLFALVPMVPDFLRRSRPEIVAETAHRLRDSVLSLIIENGYQNYEGFPVLEAAWPRVAPALSLLLAGDDKRLQTACDALFHVFNFLGRWDEMVSFFGKAEFVAAAAGDYFNAGWNAYRVGFTHSMRGEADAVFSAADRAARHWEKANAGAREQALVHRLRGGAHHNQKDFPAAVASFHTALDLVFGVDISILATTLTDLAGAEWRSGDFPAAENHYTEALEIARARDDKEGVAVITGGLARLAVDRRDWPNAERLSGEALAVAETIGRRELIAWCRALLANALVEQGKAVEALPLARDAEEALSRLGSLDVAYARDVLRQCEAAVSRTVRPAENGSE